MNKKVLNEVNRIKKMMSINEVAIYDSTDISNSEITLKINPSADQNEIVLGGKLPDGKIADNIIYKVKGKYGFIPFNILLKEIVMDSGEIRGRVKPSNPLVKGAFSLIPDDYKDEEGWLYIQVPRNKVELGLSELKNNGGESAEIDAGEGVYVLLDKK